MGQPFTAVTPASRITHHRRPASTWPFKVKPAGESVTISEFGVGVPPRQEVEFADGTRLWLLRVDQHQVPDLYLRDLGAPAEGMRVDLRRLVPELTTDLPVASTRDVPGIVHFALRGRFKSAAELIEAAIALGSPA
jgi:hypothetical protein